MKKIYFIGTLETTFKSRWKQEQTKKTPFVSTTVSGYGRQSAKQIAGSKTKRVAGQAPDYVYKQTKKLFGGDSSPKNAAQRARVNLNIDKTREPVKSVMKEGKRKLTVADKQKLAKLKENKANRIIERTVKDFNDSVKAPINTTDSPSSTSNKATTSSTKSSLLQKAGSFANKNKVALGLAGAGTLGAISYGLYRKKRSDKGKKRGRYKN